MKNVNKKKKKEDRVFSTGSAPSGGHEEGFPLPHEEGIKKKKKEVSLSLTPADQIVFLMVQRAQYICYGNPGKNTICIN